MTLFQKAYCWPFFLYFYIYSEKNISWIPQNAFGTGGNTMRESCWLCAVGGEPVVSGCTGLVAALDELSVVDEPSQFLSIHFGSTVHRIDWAQ